jgi:hypothetical protein
MRMHSGMHEQYMYMYARVGCALKIMRCCSIFLLLARYVRCIRCMHSVHREDMVRLHAG